MGIFSEDLNHLVYSLLFKDRLGMNTLATAFNTTFPAAASKLTSGT
jgi:hypothetical protein